MGGLRKAGAFLGDMDAKYAKAVEGTIENPSSWTGAARGMSSAVPIRDLTTFHGAETRDQVLQAIALNSSVGGANIAARYALPAGGVTLAGKGLMDMAAAFGSQADEPAPSQLPLQ
jgi:hypothetical protein